MKIWHYHDSQARHFLVYLNQKSLNSEIRMSRSSTPVHVFLLIPQLGGAVIVSSHPWKRTVWSVSSLFFWINLSLAWWLLIFHEGRLGRGGERWYRKRTEKKYNKAFLSLVPSCSQFGQISVTLCWGLFGPLNIPLGHSVPISCGLENFASTNCRDTGHFWLCNTSQPWSSQPACLPLYWTGKMWHESTVNVPTAGGAN